MFLGGVDNTSAEFRMPSFKGALRFWWRSLAWQRLDGNLKKIHLEEAELFGSSDQAVGQAKFLLDVEGDFPEPIPAGEVLRENGRRGGVVGPGARYFGYGVMHAFGSDKKKTKDAELTRACLPAGFEFTVRLALKRGDNVEVDERVTQLRNALCALGLFGGLGSKSRKGYGSVVLQKLDDRNIRTTPDSFVSSYKELFEENLKNVSHTLPEYTAFSGQTKIFAFKGSRQTQPMALLDIIGREMVRERSWGHNGKIFGRDEKAERNYKRDHDLMKLSGSGERVNDHPDRIAFGLPHNYGKGENNQVEPAFKTDAYKLDRRASPLFIKIHQFSDGSPVAVLSYIPAKFLPDGAKISVGKSPVNLRAEELKIPIVSLVQRLLDEGQPIASTRSPWPLPLYIYE